MRILYGASKGFASYLQIRRILDNVPEGTEIRVAGFYDSLFDIQADYCLDSLQSFYGRKKNEAIFSDSFKRYCSEIAAFEPDLIISDLEVHTSFAAFELQIPLWTLSSLNLYFGLSKETRGDIGLLRNYAYLIRRRKNFDRFHVQIENAERNLVYSYASDLADPPKLQRGFEWVRPYFVKGSDSNSPDIVVALGKTTKDKVQYISHLHPTLASMYSYEAFDFNHIDLRSSEYEDSLTSSLLTMSSGETTLIADSFYNNKYSLILPNLKDKDSVINSQIVEKYLIGETIFSRKTFEQINSLSEKSLDFNVFWNPRSQFLFDRLSR